MRKATTLPFTEMTVAGPYDASTNLGNYDTSRAPIDTIVIHTTVGSAEAAATRFADLKSNVSAHYLVKKDGSLIHFLEETYTAYHAGNYIMNKRSIGIEHEDGGDYNGIRPDALYQTSAKLVRDICQFYNIPIDRDHIKKHNEVSDAPTGCPDALDIDRIVREAQPPVDNCPAERDANWNIVNAVGDQLQIPADPNDKPGTTKKFREAIKALQDKPTTTIVQPVENPGTTTVEVPLTVDPGKGPIDVSNLQSPKDTRSPLAKLIDLILSKFK